mmetsp:Transcript_22677/g.32405  ORF Transcript_22677/g.32405 Transcript_22677/m.32405 type:complete len:88 (-) Transcript_22677:440-703(-)
MRRGKQKMKQFSLIAPLFAQKQQPPMKNKSYRDPNNNNNIPKKKGGGGSIIPPCIIYQATYNIYEPNSQITTPIEYRSSAPPSPKHT